MQELFIIHANIILMRLRNLFIFTYHNNMFCHLLMQ